MRREPVVKAEAPGSMIESTVRAKVSLDRSEQIIRTIRVRRDGCLLAVVPEPCQIPIDPAGDDLASDDCFPGRKADHQLTPTMVYRPTDCARSNLGLKNRRHRLWFAR